MHKRVLWSELPIAIGAIFLFVGGILLMAQLALGVVAHGKQMKLCAAVYGLTPPAKAELTIANLLSGQYQQAVALGIGTSEPYFAFAVRLRNQLEFSLFGIAAAPGIVVGPKLQLIQQAYIDDYCNRNLSTFMAGAPAWAAKIRRMQNNAQARGQNFLYVITPSKVATYPQILPLDMPCPSAQADRVEIVPAWVEVVKRAGVRMVDTTAILRGAAADYPFEFFPRGGTHWNEAGGALGAQAVEAGLQAERHDGLIKPFSFTWQMSSHPVGTDIDLASMMNLMHSMNKFAVPHIIVTQAAKPAVCRPLRIVIVGGSFMQRIGTALSQLPCGAKVVEYFYWSMHLISWDAGVQSIGMVDPAIRDDDLLHADVILYEENEAVLGHSTHGEAFYQWILQHEKG